MCFSRGWTGCGPGWAKDPNEYFFNVDRWNCRNFIGPMWVGKKGCLNSRAGMECCSRNVCVVKKSQFTFNGCIYFCTCNLIQPEWCYHQMCPSDPAAWDSRTRHWRGSRGPSPQVETCSELRQNIFPTERQSFSPKFVTWGDNLPVAARLLSPRFSQAGCGSFWLPFPSYSLLRGNEMLMLPFHLEFLNCKKKHFRWVKLVF